MHYWRKIKDNVEALKEKDFLIEKKLVLLPQDVEESFIEEFLDCLINVYKNISKVLHSFYFIFKRYRPK